MYLLPITAFIIFFLHSCSCSEKKKDSPASEENSSSTIVTSLEQVDAAALQIRIQVEGNGAPITDKDSLNVIVSQFGDLKSIHFFADTTCETLLISSGLSSDPQTVAIPLSESGSYPIFYRAEQDSVQGSCLSANLTLFRIGTIQISLVYNTTNNSRKNKLNYYVNADDLTQDCNAATATNCVHAGLARKIVVPEITSCQGLTASDNLGVFQWRCAVNNNQVQFSIADFQRGKGLRDLLHTDGAFLSFSVSIQGGLDDITTEAVNGLWDNNIVALPGTAGGAATDLNLADTIYYFTGITTTDGYYTITADGVALVGLTNATLDHGNHTGGFITSSNDFLWLEGHYTSDGSGDEGVASLVRFTNSRFGRVQNAMFTNSSQEGLYLSACENFVVSDVESSGHAEAGMWVSDGGGDHLFKHILTHSNTIHGIGSGTATKVLRYFDIYSANNDGSGLVIGSSSTGGTIVQNVFLHSNATGASVSSDNSIVSNILLSSSDQYLGLHGEWSILQNVTTVNIDSWGVNATENSLTLANIATVNTTNSSFNILGSSQLYDIAAVKSGQHGMNISGAGVNVDFTGWLILGEINSNLCQLGGGATSNLATTTCDNSLAPEVSLTTGVVSGTIFAGALAAGDTDNADSAQIALGSGFLAIGSITDWGHFSFPHFGWGTGANTSHTHAANVGQCTLGNCAAWNLSLHSGDLGDAVAARAILYERNPCPDGEQYISHTFQSSVTVNFLRYAYEVYGDGVGNDNGLCESGEACVYSPHIGSFQGTGELIDSSCSDIGNNGTVKNVELLEWSQR